MVSAFGHEMSDEKQQISEGTSMHVRVTMRPFRGRNPESVVAVTEPELNSLISGKFPSYCWANSRQLVKSRQSKLSQIPKNHPFRIGPSTASHGSDQNLKWSSDAQDPEEI
jgi:hypothetical protein